jgi:hypothetical protein
MAALELTHPASKTTIVDAMVASEESATSNDKGKFGVELPISMRRRTILMNDGTSKSKALPNPSCLSQNLIGLVLPNFGGWLRSTKIGK